MSTSAALTPLIEFWHKFVSATDKFVHVRLEIGSFSLKSFSSFARQTVQAVLRADFVNELGDVWSKFTSVHQRRHEADIHPTELQAFVRGNEEVTGQDSSETTEPPPKKRWASREVTAARMLKTAGIILTSLREALQDLLSDWMKGLLRAFGELIDIMSQVSVKFESRRKLHTWQWWSY